MSGDRVLACFAPDASYLPAYGPEPLGAECRGHAAIRAAIEEGFRAWPGGNTVVTSTLLAGERGLAQWYFEFTDPEGRSTRVHGCDAYEFRGGKVRVKNSYVKQYVPG